MEVEDAFYNLVISIISLQYLVTKIQLAHYKNFGTLCKFYKCNFHNFTLLPHIVMQRKNPESEKILSIVNVTLSDERPRTQFTVV